MVGGWDGGYDTLCRPPRKHPFTPRCGWKIFSPWNIDKARGVGGALYTQWCWIIDWTFRVFRSWEEFFYILFKCMLLLLIFLPRWLACLLTLTQSRGIDYQIKPVIWLICICRWNKVIMNRVLTMIIHVKTHPLKVVITVSNLWKLAENSSSSRRSVGRYDHPSPKSKQSNNYYITHRRSIYVKI